jgi:hypothetical protein
MFGKDKLFFSYSHDGIDEKVQKNPKKTDKKRLQEGQKKARRNANTTKTKRY